MTQRSAKFVGHFMTIGPMSRLPISEVSLTFEWNEVSNEGFLSWSLSSENLVREQGSGYITGSVVAGLMDVLHRLSRS